MSKRRPPSARRHRGQILVLACAGIALATALAACSSSGSGSSSSSASGSAGATANKSPLVIGGIGSIQYSGLGGADVGFKARIDRINKEGGIDGHPIELQSFQDDNASAATALSEIQQMILKNKVFAIFDAGSAGIDKGAIAFATAHKTPIFGFPYTPDQCGNAWFWPVVTGGCFVASPQVGAKSTGGVIPDAMAKALNKPVSSFDWAYETINAFPASAAGALGGNAIQQAGANPVYYDNSIPVNPPPTDYTPWAQSVLQAKPNVVHSGLPYTFSLGFFQALEAQGYKGPMYADGGVPSNLFTAGGSALSIMNGVYVGTFYPTPQDNTPASNQELADLKAVDGFSGGQSFGNGTNSGYWSAEGIVDMLTQFAKTGGDVTDAAALEQYVNSGKYTYHGPQGYIPTQDWPASENGPSAGCRAVQVVDAAAKTLELKVPFTCFPLVTITAIPPLKK